MNESVIRTSYRFKEGLKKADCMKTNLYVYLNSIRLLINRKQDLI